MPYTIVWDAAQYLGSIDADRIDDEHRLLKTAIEERMDDVLGVGQWASDPVVDLTNSTTVVGPFNGVDFFGVDSLEANNTGGVTAFIQPLTTSSSGFRNVSLTLPSNIILKQIDLLCWEETSATVSIEVWIWNQSSIVATRHFDNLGPSSSSASWQTVTAIWGTDQGTSTHSLMAGESVYLEINLASNSSTADSARYGGAILTYDRTSAF